MVAISHLWRGLGDSWGEVGLLTAKGLKWELYHARLLELNAMIRVLPKFAPKCRFVRLKWRRQSVKVRPTLCAVVSLIIHNVCTCAMFCSVWMSSAMLYWVVARFPARLIELKYHPYNRKTHQYHRSRQLFVQGHGSGSLSIMEGMRGQDGGWISSKAFGLKRPTLWTIGRQYRSLCLLVGFYVKIIS